MKFFKSDPALALLAILFFFAFSQWFIKIKDNDFWWHIKTGQYILEHRSLPDKDPFTFTFIEHDRDMPERPEAILKSYWLSQIILYLIYHNAGPIGIILLKIFIFGLILLLLWKYLMDEGVSSLLSAIMLAGYIVFAKEYMTERPQIFSFLFSTIVFNLLEGIRKVYSVQREAYSKDKSVPHTLPAIRYTLLPLVMLIWANMHGGYLVGISFIMVYAACLLFRRNNVKGKAPAVVLYLASILLTLVNPVTYHGITSFFALHGGMLEKEAFEHNSPLGVLGHLNTNWYPYFGLIVLSLAVVVIGTVGRLLVNRKAEAEVEAKEKLNLNLNLSIPPEHLTLILGTAIASLSSLRYGMFFMIIALPVVASSIDRIQPLNVPASVRKGINAIFSAMLIVMSLRGPLLKESHANFIEESVLPVKAVEFIKEKLPEENIYNDIDWGGFLIWKLYPQYKFFCDTRNLNIEIFRQYLSILKSNEQKYFGIPEWKALLNMYGINTIIHGTVNPFNGETYPLILRLIEDESWHLIYYDGVAAIFTKKMSGKFVELPKAKLRREMR